MLPYDAPHNKHAVDALFAAVLWDLVVEGLIVPGHCSHLRDYGNESWKVWPAYTITPHGFAVLTMKTDTVSPHDSVRYLTDARERLRDADEAISLYLEEANRAFIARLYLSSVVMLGVSAEALMEWLIKRIRLHLTPDGVSRFDRSLNKDRGTADRFSKLLREISSHRGEMSADLAVKVEPQLGSVVSILKTYRDDVAHRRPFRVDKQLANGQLIIFLATLSVAAEIASVFSHPCSLKIDAP